MKPAAYEKQFLILLFGAGLLVLIKTNILTIPPFQQYIDIAQAFLHGQFNFLPNARTIYDSALFEGKYFWPLGPFPILMLIPFVALFGTTFQLGYMHFLVLLLTWYLLYKIALRLLESQTGAMWLSFGYIFSTAFIGLAWFPSSWQFAQVTGAMFLIAALYEFLHKRRWWLVGIFIALATASRISLILGAVFFVGYLLWAQVHTKEKLNNLVLFGVPILFTIMLLLLYNYVRFDDFFEQGYVLQTLTVPELVANRSEGTWSLVHIPANLYYFFFKGPDPVLIPGTQILTFPYLKPNDWGLSFLFTSPLFLWLIKAPFRKKEVILASIAAILMAVAIFGYYGIGYIQYGSRYACDFYPFLFIILLLALHKHISKLLKVVIVLTFIFNVFLLFFK